MKVQTSLLKLALIVGATFAAAPQRTDARSGSVNGFGYGTATVRVWCAPNAPPAPPDYTASQTGFVPTASLSPGLEGCNPNTRVFLSGGSLWRWNQASAARGYSP